MHNREFKFGYQHFLLCQKPFLKVSSKWILKNKSDNGKLLLGKTYSGEHFRAILALLLKLFVQCLCQKLCSICIECLSFSNYNKRNEIISGLSPAEIPTAGSKPVIAPNNKRLTMETDQKPVEPAPVVPRKKHR